MKVLLVGKGAREHAIAWKLSQSSQVDELLVAPGNAGTAQVAHNLPVAADDVEALLGLAIDNGVDLTVVGPEAPLAAGIVDIFEEAGLLVFGPTQAAARIESSKSFAKQLMLSNGVPTGRAEVFDSYADAEGYMNRTDPPVVVKADGLAEGKGVTVARTRTEAIDALRQAMVESRFGDAGRRVLIEECLQGTEMSVFAFVDGQRISSLVAACDYKPVGDGNTGLNTGGMGSYSPPQGGLWSSESEAQVREEIIEPVVNALAANSTPYRGVLYAGLMMTADGPKVIEFNCRMGDPEAQAVLPRLKSDLLQVMIATARGDLDRVRLEWDPRACVGVVLASGGYPGEYTTGHEIGGLNDIDLDSMVFHAGTRAVQGRTVSDGGRVLTVAALGETLEAARAGAYSNVGRVGFAGAFSRSDIAAQPAVTSPERSLTQMPLVGVIMGSKSDEAYTKETSEVLEQMGVEHEVVVASAHRTPDKVRDYAQSARGRGIEVLIAAAGGSAGLPGVLASWTTLPVIGVPLPTSDLNGVDSLHAIAQMPPGIPVACVAVGSWGARNAAHLATQILAGKHQDIAAAYEKYREGLRNS